jgi:hypothetical protein
MKLLAALNGIRMALGNQYLQISLLITFSFLIIISKEQHANLGSLVVTIDPLPNNAVAPTEEIITENTFAEAFFVDYGFLVLHILAVLALGFNSLV